MFDLIKYSSAVKDKFHDFSDKFQSFCRESGALSHALKSTGWKGFAIDAAERLKSTLFGKKIVEGSSDYTVTESSHLFYATFGVAKTLQRGEVLLNPHSFPGIAFKESGRNNQSCIEYAFERTSTLNIRSESDVPRSPIDDLDGWVNVAPSDAQPGDVIFYFQDARRFPHIFTEHFGIVKTVDPSTPQRPALTIVSKWGRKPVYEHDLDRVLEQYGPHFLIMRNAKAPTDSLALRTHSRYSKLVSLAAVLSTLAASAIVKTFTDLIDLNLKYISLGFLTGLCVASRYSETVRDRIDDLFMKIQSGSLFPEPPLLPKETITIESQGNSLQEDIASDDEDEIVEDDEPIQ